MKTIQKNELANTGWLLESSFVGDLKQVNSLAMVIGSQYLDPCLAPATPTPLHTHTTKFIDTKSKTT